MKKTIFALAAMAIASAAFAHGSSGTVSGTNTVSSGSSAVASASGNGLSISVAGNKQFATNEVTSAGTAGGGFVGKYGTGVDTRYGSIAQVGAVTTGGASFAGNVSVGNASGAAIGNGYSYAENSGKGEFHTTGDGPKGNTSGYAAAETGTSVIAGKNGAGLSVGGSFGAWGATANAELVTIKALNQNVSDTKNAGSLAGATAGATNFGSSLGNATNSQLVNAESGAKANSSVNGKVSVSHN